MDEKEVSQQTLSALRAEIDELLGEFKKLSGYLIGQESQAKHHGVKYTANIVNSEIKEEFFAWHEKFINLLKKAENSGAIDQGFFNKYKNYTAEDWEQDPSWQQIQAHFKQLDEYDEKILELSFQVGQLDYAQGVTNRSYGLAAIITSFTVVIPLLIGLVCLIDNIAHAVKIKGIEDQKAPINQQIEAAKSDLSSKNISSDQKDLYYQAAKLGSLSFFKPLKEEAIEKEATKQATSGPSLSNSSNDNSK